MKSVATFMTATSACFFLNIFTHHNIQYAFYNSLLLGTSLLMVNLATNKLTGLIPVFIIVTSLIPLFHFIPNNPIIYIFIYTYLTLWLIASKFTKVRNIFIAVGFVSLLWGTLISNNILTFPSILNRDRLIFNDRVSQEKISYHQKDARYVPYRVRLILFNKSINIYSFFSSIFHFLTLKNLYDTLLLANIYPLVVGVIQACKNRTRSFNGNTLLALLLTFMIVGLNRSPDKFNSLFIAAPLFLYLIYLGLQKINKNIYIVLFIFSLILATNPI
jgi:hypothetical protein